jgi:heptosyltransferase I
MNTSPRILIIRLSSLGDILHALPAFSSLRAAFPEAKIEWLASKKCSFLPAAVPGIDALHVLDTDSLLNLPPDLPAWRQFRSLIRELRARRFDFVLDFQGLLKTAFLGMLTGSGMRLGFSKELVRERPAHWFYHRTLEKPQNQVHVLELNRMLAALTGAHPMSAPIEFLVPAEDERYVQSILGEAQLQKYVIINPGGGWPTKRWDPGRYGELANRIQAELGIPVGVTTGPGEEGFFHAIADFCRNPAPRHFPVSFLQLIPLLRRACLFIGGDTGPFHLACALGTPVVGIFGPTSPVRNGPWGDSDEVVTLSLPCGSCYGRTCSRNNECMNITVDQVFDAVVKRLSIREGSSIALR